ncbi:MAG: c-type cytochrome, partial [Candidatus Acidiferrales bacterium]
MTPAMMLVALTLGSALLRGTSSAAAAPQSAEAANIFSVRCAGCHGADAEGTNQGPALAGARRLRGRPVAWIRNVIHNGIPSGGMPAFDLTANSLDALAAFVHSLNSPAAENAIPGDRAAGEQYFFGQGRCAACHMVDGRGEAVGPDLSNVANEMTAVEIRSSLLRPSTRMIPGYELVKVQLRNGKRLRGFARSRSNFEIVVQDLNGQFHLLEHNEISAVQEEKGSLMPPVTASPEELQNLIAYLSRLTGVPPGAAKVMGSSKPGGISFSRILHPRPGDWLTYNGDLNGNRYSELTQINTGNVKDLRLKWIFTIPLWKQFLPDNAYFRAKMQFFGVEATPIVADGIMYVTGPHEAFALDAATGQEIWQYRRPRPLELNVGDAALGTNRGVAILGNK